MNRRGFLKLITAAVVAPAVLVAKAAKAVPGRWVHVDEYEKRAIKFNGEAGRSMGVTFVQGPTPESTPENNPGDHT